jgi:hypothetical protein
VVLGKIGKLDPRRNQYLVYGGIRKTQEKDFAPGHTRWWFKWPQRPSLRGKMSHAFPTLSRKFDRNNKAIESYWRIHHSVFQNSINWVLTVHSIRNDQTNEPFRIFRFLLLLPCHLFWMLSMEEERPSLLLSVIQICKRLVIPIPGPRPRGEMNP